MINNIYFCIRHCTSFRVCKLPALATLRVPLDLHRALNNTSPNDDKLYNGYVKFIKYLPWIKKIEPENYLTLFKMLLYLEDHECRLIIAKHNLKNWILKRVFNELEIIVPTLNEDDPFIVVGDKVTIKNSLLSYTVRITEIIEKKVYVTTPPE